MVLYLCLFKENFSEKYDKICESLLVNIIPSVRNEDTELLLKLFTPKIDKKNNLGDILNKNNKPS